MALEEVIKGLAGLPVDQQAAVRAYLSAQNIQAVQNNDRPFDYVPPQAQPLVNVRPVTAGVATSQGGKLGAINPKGDSFRGNPKIYTNNAGLSVFKNSTGHQYTIDKKGVATLFDPNTEYTKEELAYAAANNTPPMSGITGPKTIVTPIVTPPTTTPPIITQPITGDNTSPGYTLVQPDARIIPQPAGTYPIPINDVATNQGGIIYPGYTFKENPITSSGFKTVNQNFPPNTPELQAQIDKNNQILAYLNSSVPEQLAQNTKGFRNYHVNNVTQGITEPAQFAYDFAKGLIK